METVLHTSSPYPPRTTFVLDEDLRRHRQIPVSLSGRYMREDRTEHEFTVSNISVGGALAQTDAELRVGEKIVAYIADIGSLDGHVARLTPNGFAFQYKVSEHKREKLAAKIMWVANREQFPDAGSRAADRIAANGLRSTLRFRDGLTIDVDVIDISASGASLATDARPALETPVQLGSVAAFITRHHESGIAVRFRSLQQPSALRGNL